jgi:2-polyprenyl-6-methoxyphenol hydroxylase-like FAD-dependent oxidoreductase
MSISADHAIVIGSSMAGMTAAKAISPFFKQVTIIEPDELPETVAQRRGVPQGYHLHGMLNAGRVVLDTLFPGFTEKMIAMGAPYFDHQREMPTRYPEGWLCRVNGGLKVLCARRTSFEYTVRNLTYATPNIQAEIGTVFGLLASADGSSIAGVRVKGPDGVRTEMADLVIDASGRASKSPWWMEDLGFEVPTETVVKSYLGYATIFVETPEGVLPRETRAMSVAPFPGCLRGGFITPQDDGTIGIMAAGQNKDYPPDNLEAFDDFIKTTSTPLFREIFRASRPVSDINLTRTSHNRLRNWHMVKQRPGRFLIVGDAVAAYNPVYGQGMTSAALQAMMLHNALSEAESLDEAANALQLKIVASVSFPWIAATEADMAFPGTITENLQRDNGSEDAASYLRAVRLVSTIDGAVGTAFTYAMHMQDLASLYEPELRERVIRLAPAVPTRTEEELAYPPHPND